MHFFPRPREIGPFGGAFIRIMFAYAELDRRFAALHKTISGGEDDFHRNPWSVEDRPKKMRRLIRENKKRLGAMPPDEVKQISEALKRACGPSDIRNTLVHGHWWKLDPKSGVIDVRRGKRRPGKKPFVKFRVTRIEQAADELLNIEAALYKVQSAIEHRLWKD